MYSKFVYTYKQIQSTRSMMSDMMCAKMVVQPARRDTIESPCHYSDHEEKNEKRQGIRPSRDPRASKAIARIALLFSNSMAFSHEGTCTYPTNHEDVTNKEHCGHEIMRNQRRCAVGWRFFITPTWLSRPTRTARRHLSTPVLLLLLRHHLAQARISPTNTVWEPKNRPELLEARW